MKDFKWSECQADWEKLRFRLYFTYSGANSWEVKKKCWLGPWKSLLISDVRGRSREAKGTANDLGRLRIRLAIQWLFSIPAFNTVEKNIPITGIKQYLTLIHRSKDKIKSCLFDWLWALNRITKSIRIFIFVKFRKLLNFIKSPYQNVY